MTDKRGISRAQQTPVGVSADAVRTAPPPPIDTGGLAVPIRGGKAARARGALFRRLLALADTTALLVGLAVADLVILGAAPSSLLWGLAFAPVWILVIKLHGLYDLDHRRIRHSTLDELPILISSSIIGTVAIGGLTHLIGPAPSLTDAAMIVLASTAFVAEASARSVTRHLWHSRRPKEKSALVGSGGAMIRLRRRIETHPEVHLAVVGYFGDGPISEGNGAARSLPYLGPSSDLLKVAEERGLEHIVVAQDSIPAEELSLLIGECKRFGLSLTLVAPHAGLLGPGIQLNRMGELPLLDFGFSDPPRSTQALKRAIDLIVSGFLLVLLSPLLLAIAVAIKLGSRGPILFRQTRIGKDGKPFTMVKFRTMVAGADEMVRDVVDTSTLLEPSFKLPDDPRRTKVGRRLRRLSLDELPQLWNVLRGEMSLVGPRPEEEQVVHLYDERQRVRLSVKPGLTGPMQVYGRGDLTFEERLALERDYIDNLSIAQDVAILLRTPRAVIGGNGAY
jgi:exopolysaccharide biosynthesis polyprenyl glycosylphosphotransferase